MDDTMTDVNPVEGEETLESPPSSDEIKTPVEDKPQTETPEPSEAEDKGEPKTEEALGKEPTKKGANSRIRELVQERDVEREKASSLAKQLEELTQGVTPPAQQPQSQVQPGSEVTPEQYQADVTRTADALVQLRLHQQKTIDRINSEASEAIRTYPELDPESESFDKELSNTVSEATLAMVRVNPQVSVKQFVNKLMKPYQASLNKAVGKESENIAKQVSQTALRPTSVPSADKKAEDMTVEELEKKLPSTW